MTIYNFMPDEWYPVATLFQSDPESTWHNKVDVPEELLEEGRRIQRELNAWQDKLVALLPPLDSGISCQAEHFQLVMDWD